MTRECTDCIYYDELTDDTGADVGGGICKRYPPTPLVMIDTDREFEVVPTLPTVRSDHWCGEFNDGYIAPTSMIFPDIGNISGRIKFEDWMRQNCPTVKAEYIGEELRMVYSGNCFTAKPGDRIAVDSIGVRII